MVTYRCIFSGSGSEPKQTSFIMSHHVASFVWLRRIIGFRASRSTPVSCQQGELTRTATDYVLFFERSSARNQSCVPWGRHARLCFLERDP